MSDEGPWAVAADVLSARGPHAHPPWRWLTEATLYGHLLVLLLGVPLTLLLALQHPVALALVLLAAAQTVPALTRGALIRARLWRLARLQPWLDFTAVARDRRGVGVLAAALCHLRRPDDLACALWIDRQLEDTQVVGPGEVTAAGIRAFVRGDLPEARRLWRFALEYDETVTPPWIAATAADLLLAEAAASGDRDRLHRLLAGPRMPVRPLGRLLQACEAAEAGRPSALRWLWLALTPSRPLLALVRRVGEAPVAPRDAVPPEDPLVAAVLHTMQLDRAATHQRVADAARAWEAALAAPAVAARVADHDLRERIVSLLAQRLDAVPDPAPPEPPASELLQEVVWRTADQRDVELGWLADEIGHRTLAARELPLVEEVRAFCALCEAYERVVDVAPDRASASFPRLYYPVVKHTVWLHNRRGQSRVANAMYRVELRYAERCAHDSGMALLKKNLDCGP
ncbi:MAG: hypothetical protein R3F59_20315 [Myxococcota bacterium]